MPNNLVLEALGFVAAGFAVFVFVSSTMIPLRIAAIVSNLLFAVYFFYKGIYPQCALNVALLPLNLFRLRQMQRLIAATKAAASGDFNFDWLRPYMRPQRLKAGETLYRKGAVANHAFIVVSGRISLPEVDAFLEDGALFGEMGLFSEGGLRTASAVAVGDVDLLRISYEDMMQLAAQNPQFGFYLMQIIMRRMQKNVALAQDLAARADQDKCPRVTSSAPPT